ncbi:MAG: sporulation protein YqfD [Acetobacteraceae bacterium]|nr:sporulation protein YqfD [Acetobacteraceae bacterium]
MAPSRIWRYLTGYLEVSFRGPLVERLVNLAVGRGAHLWALERSGDRLRARMTVSSFRKLRPLARATRSRVRLERKVGLPFRLRRLRRRTAFWAGLLLFLAGLYYFTSCVWVIEIQGLKRIPLEEMQALLARAGVRPGVRRDSVRPDEVRRWLIASEPAIAWVGVSLRGVRCLVQVAEDEPGQVQRWLNLPGDLVAARDGVLVKLVVLAGQAEVREGETVKRGQVLIRGAGYAGGRLQPVRARGVCLARTWYEAYREAETGAPRTRTGRRYTRVLIRLNHREIIVWGWRPVPFTEYEVSEASGRPGLWRNIRLPVEILTRDYWETAASGEPVPPAAAQADALERAEAEVAFQLGRGAQVVSRRVEVFSPRRDVVGVRLVVEAREDIGRFLPYQPAAETAGAGGKAGNFGGGPKPRGAQAPVGGQRGGPEPLRAL